MKKTLHPTICAVWIIVALTACDKKQDAHGSKSATPGKPNTSAHPDAAAVAEQDQPGKGSDDPSDSYFQAYLLTRAAGEMTNREESIRKLQEALCLLRAVKKQFPEWKIEMVNARIQMTEESLADLSTF